MSETPTRGQIIDYVIDDSTANDAAGDVKGNSVPMLVIEVNENDGSYFGSVFFVSGRVQVIAVHPAPAPVPPSDAQLASDVAGLTDADIVRLEKALADAKAAREQSGGTSTATTPGA